MKYPKEITLLVLLLMLALVSGAAAQKKESKETPSTKSTTVKEQSGDKITVPLSDPSRPAYIKASLMNGSITVKGYSGKEVVVTADQRPGEDDDEDEDDHDMSDRERERRRGMKRISSNTSSLTVEEDNNEVQIGTGWRAMSSTLDMVIQVPVNSSLKLNTMNDGDITVNGVKGDVEVSNLNGNILIKEVDGSVVADAMNGDIDVVFTGIDSKKSMSFSSMNGEIDVTLPASSKATLRLKSDQGEIYSDFDMKLDVATEDSRASGRSKNGRYKVTIEKVMTGVLNGGGAEMTFNNFNGNIYIRKGK